MKILLNIDRQGYTEKPSSYAGAIRNRLCNVDKITEATPEQLMECIRRGYSFTPAVMTGTTGSHACSYHLTGKFGIPHGEACAFTADAWYRINAEVRPELNDFAREIGFADAGALADGLNALKREVGLRCTLTEAGIDPSFIPEIADFTVKASNWGNNVNQVEPTRIEQFLKQKIQ